MSKIIVYSNTDCSPCKFVKKYLEDKGVEFEERNISKNDKYQEELMEMGYMKVPVVVKEFEKEAPHGNVRKSVVGTNFGAIDELLESFE